MRGFKKVTDILKNMDPEDIRRTKDMAALAGTAGAGMATGAYAFEKLKRKIQNEPRRKAILEDLRMNDPVISDADPEEVLRYYSTMYSVAPELSMDKNAVKEFLQNAVRFGRVDIQTIKSLAETEKSVKQNKDSQSVLGQIKGK